MGYMYILKCSNGQFYTGSTIDLNLRITQHQNGEGSNFTKKYLPIELVYFESFIHIEDAFKREKQVQGWTKAKKIALINSDFNLLKQLSQCKNDTHYLK